MTDYTCTLSIQEHTFCMSWFSEFDGHVLIGGSSVPSEMASKSHSAGLAAILYFGGNDIHIVKVQWSPGLHRCQCSNITLDP